MDSNVELLKEIESLEQEHEELNQIIDDPESLQKFSEFTLQKFKKRKLLLKDKIKIYKTSFSPNDIA
jgi:hypothetical protein